MQPQNNKNFMKSITGDTTFFSSISKSELQEEVFVMLDTIFSFLSENEYHPKKLIFKTSRNSNYDFDFWQELLFPEPVTQLEIIRDTISNIIVKLPDDYNEVARIMIVLYYW